MTYSAKKCAESGKMQEKRPNWLLPAQSSRFVIYILVCCCISSMRQHNSERQWNEMLEHTIPATPLFSIYSLRIFREEAIEMIYVSYFILCSPNTRKKNIRYRILDSTYFPMQRTNYEGKCVISGHIWHPYWTVHYLQLQDEILSECSAIIRSYYFFNLLFLRARKSSSYE